MVEQMRSKYSQPSLKSMVKTISNHTWKPLLEQIQRQSHSKITDADFSHDNQTPPNPYKPWISLNCLATNRGLGGGGQIFIAIVIKRKDFYNEGLKQSFPSSVQISLKDPSRAAECTLESWLVFLDKSKKYIYLVYYTCICKRGNLACTLLANTNLGI